MGQCNSTLAVASTAPQDGLKTPRSAERTDAAPIAATELPISQQQSPPTHTAQVPAASEAHEPSKTAPVTTDAHTTPGHLPAATEPRPFCDAASLQKPVEEVSLVTEEPVAAPAASEAAPDASKEPAVPAVSAAQHATEVCKEPEAPAAAMPATDHSHADNREPQHSSPDRQPSTELAAHVQDSVSVKDAVEDPPHTVVTPSTEADTVHGQPKDDADHQAGSSAGHKTDGSAGQQADGSSADCHAGGRGLVKEPSSTDGGSPIAIQDGGVTQHSIKSNSSVSPEHSSLIAAAGPEAMHDEVSQSAPKGAPSAAVSMAPSHMASGDLNTEHSASAPAPTTDGEGPSAAGVSE